MSSGDGNQGILIIVKGSRNCEVAEEYLRAVGFEYRVADAQDLGILSDLKRDLGVSELPALVTSSGTFEGLDRIRAVTASDRR